MELQRNMEFAVKSSFVPNISNAESLKIIEVSKNSVVVQMNNSGCRGVFPLDNFQYWIRRSSLVYINESENEEKSS